LLLLLLLLLLLAQRGASPPHQQLHAAPQPAMNCDRDFYLGLVVTRGRKCCAVAFIVAVPYHLAAVLRFERHLHVFRLMQEQPVYTGTSWPSAVYQN
jgi:hypothetical protein